MRVDRRPVRCFASQRDPPGARLRPTLNPLACAADREVASQRLWPFAPPRSSGAR